MDGFWWWAHEGWHYPTSEECLYSPFYCKQLQAGCSLNCHILFICLRRIIHYCHDVTCTYIEEREIAERSGNGWNVMHVPSSCVYRVYVLYSDQLIILSFLLQNLSFALGSKVLHPITCESKFFFLKQRVEQYFGIVFPLLHNLDLRENEKN